MLRIKTSEVIYIKCEQIDKSDLLSNGVKCPNKKTSSHKQLIEHIKSFITRDDKHLSFTWITSEMNSENVVVRIAGSERGTL